MLDDTWFQILQITELVHAKYECIISNRQCGKFEFFVSFRFYVKSVLENLEVQKVQLFNSRGSEVF